MENIREMVSFIVAMMGVAFPLLLKMISELSDKYGTLRIITRFKSEPIYKLFVGFLIGSIVASILWIINSPPIKIDIIENILSGSSEYMLLILGIITIVFFFKLVFLILLYYEPVKITKRLLPTGYQGKKIKPEFRVDDSLKIVTSIITSYIRIGSEDIVRDLIQLFSESIRSSISDTNKNEYERIYYDLTDNIFNACLLRNDRAFDDYILGILNSVWFSKHKANELVASKSLDHTWFNIEELIKRDRINLLMSYWASADARVRDYMFNHDLLPNLLSDDCVDKLILNWVQAINSELLQYGYVKELVVLPDYLESQTDPGSNKLLPLLKYICFHTSLGGLLLYLRKYDAIRRVFSYSSSLPPTYHLLPDTFTEVFRFYLMTDDPHEIFSGVRPATYIFPELDGINQSESTRSYICAYIAVLYIRLFSLFQMYSLTYHYKLPSLPNDKFMLNVWKSSAESLKRKTLMLLDNKEVLQGIGLESVVDKEKAKIRQKLDEFTDSIDAQIESIETSYQPSSEQEEEFKNQVAITLSKSIQKFMFINNEAEIDKDYSSWHILGEKRIVGKDDFHEDPRRTEVVTYPLITGIQSKLYQSFYSQNVTRYLVSAGDLFPAVNKLKADMKQFVLIGFNITISYFINALKVKDLSEGEFQGIKLCLYFSSSRHDSHSLFLVKKSDLPSFIFHDCEQSEIDKYSLLESNSQFKIFTSLIDLNTEQSLKDELQPTFTGIDLKKCMLATVDYHVEIRWKNNPQMVHLQLYNRNMNLGIPVDIRNITPL
jgi:gas vesicle protein